MWVQVPPSAQKSSSWPEQKEKRKNYFYKNYKHNYNHQSFKFANLFKPYTKENIIQWNGSDAVGISILRNYPDHIKFISAKNEKGENDSVALIKIGYTSIDEHNIAKLYVSISKASKYLLAGNFDFISESQDPNAPTRSSLEESKKSKQPISLEENEKFALNLATNKIKDLEENKYVRPDKIINYIYQLHLETLSYSASLFRLKMLFQRGTVNVIPRINDIIKWLIRTVFGKTLKETDDFSIGIFKPYPIAYMRALSDEKTKIFGSDFPITNRSAISFACLTLLVFIVNNSYHYDFLGLANLADAANKNLLFSASFIGVIVFLFDTLLPTVLLLLINVLIILNVKIMNTRIKFH